MLYRKFEPTGDMWSALGFGAMGMGGWFGDVNEDASTRALHAALDLGVNIIDTARAYKGSERLVGAALRRWSGERPFVATKVEPLGGISQFGIPLPVEEAFPAGWIIASCEESLRQLDLEHVDLMQLHLYWPTWGTDGYWMEELQALKTSGKVRAIGVSIPDHRHDSAIALVQSGLIDSVQTIINVFASEPFDTLVPICQDHGVAVLARCVLDEGGLTGFLNEHIRFEDGDMRHGYFDWTVPRSAYIAKVDALRQYIPQHASSLASLAIKFVASNPAVTTSLSSMHIEDFARANIAALDEPPLDEDLVYKLRTEHRFAVNLSHAGHWPVAGAQELV